MAKSIFRPAAVEAILKNEQTRCVCESASGSASISVSSAAVIPFCTIAPNPPMKLMLALAAASSSTSASLTAVLTLRGSGSSSRAAGVTEMRRFVIGTPYLASMASAYWFSNRPFSVMRFFTRLAKGAKFRSMQSFRFMPSVTVRMSKLYASRICTVSKTSSTVILMAVPYTRCIILKMFSC